MYVYVRVIEVVFIGMCILYVFFGLCFSDEIVWNRLFENILNVDWSFLVSLEFI